MRAGSLIVSLTSACVAVHAQSAVAAAQEANVRLGGLFAEAPRAPAAKGPEPELVDIERDLDALAQRSDAAVASAAIARGRAALFDARDALTAGRRETATRQKQIAWAALSLAQRRIAAAAAAREAAHAHERERSERAEHARAEAELAAAEARLHALREQAAR